MPQVNQLNTDTNLSLSDLIALYSVNNSDLRKASLSSLLALLQSNLTLPNGLLSAASLYIMRTGAAPLAYNATVAQAPVAPMDPTLNFIQPSGAVAFSPNPATGQFFAARNVKAAIINVNVAMTYVSARRLVLQVCTGPVGNPTQFKTPIAFAGIGQDANQMYANFTGIVYNPNNMNGQLNLGDIVEVAASIDVAAVVTLQSMSIQLQPMDGL